MTSSIGTGRPSSRSRLVTPRPRMPQGTIRSKADRSVATLKAKPCDVTQRAIRTPIAPILSRPTQVPVSPSTRPASTP